MKRLLRVSAAVALSTLCGSLAWSAGSESKKLEAFSELELSGRVDVDINFAVEGAGSALSGAADVLSNLSTTLIDGRFVIDTQKSLATEKPLQLDTSELKLIRVNSSSDVRVRNFKGETLMIEILGSGDVTVQGEVNSLQIHLMGSGEVLAKELLARTASVKILGSGDAFVTVADQLKIQIMGSGDVHYSGTAQVKKSILGSGAAIAD